MSRESFQQYGRLVGRRPILSFKGGVKLKYKMLNVRDLAAIAMCIAIAVVLGKVVGIFHKVLPFSRGIINAPFFSFIIAMMLYKIRKPGAVSLFAMGYGLMMVRMSIFAFLSSLI
jgi:hypothetical protein